MLKHIMWTTFFVLSTIPMIGLAAPPGCYQCHNENHNLKFTLEPANTCFIAPEFKTWVVTVCEKKNKDHGRSIMHISMGDGKYKVMHSQRKYDYEAERAFNFKLARDKLDYQLNSLVDKIAKRRLLYDPGRRKQ